jgi:hypothetical protein
MRGETLQEDNQALCERALRPQLRVYLIDGGDGRDAVPRTVAS